MRATLEWWKTRPEARRAMMRAGSSRKKVQDALGAWLAKAGDATASPT